MNVDSDADSIFTWPEFKEWVTGLAEGGGSYFCRGQSDESWKLSTSFHRRAGSIDLSLKDFLNVVIPAVHYEASAALNYRFDLGNELDLGAFLALCQHHGFPTPLLDWTLSPYIAAYFAFRDVKETRHSSDHVKIFLLDYSSWFQSYKQPLDLRRADPYVSLLRPFAALNYRILPQQGAFTVTNVEDVEAHLRACEVSAGKRFLYTIRIGVKAKPSVMRDLNMMGISERSLFPGLDGLFSGLANRIFACAMGETTPELLRRLSQPVRPPLPLAALGVVGQAAHSTPFAIPPPLAPNMATSRPPVENPKSRKT